MEKKSVKTESKKTGGWSSTSRKLEEQSIGDILSRITGSGIIKDKFLEAEITALYEAMVGRNVARLTDNIFVNKEKLFIKVSSPALRQELVYSRDKIRSLVNEKLSDKHNSVQLLEFIKEVIIL